MDLINTIRNVYGFLKELKADRKAIEDSDSISSRILSVFESHGVHRNQINRFMGYEFSISDYQSPESFMKHITDQMISDVSNKFSIRQEWIECASEQVHEWHYFYKQPEEYRNFLISQLENKDRHDINLILLNSKKKNGSWLDDVILILREYIGVAGEKRIYKYKLLNGWRFNYCTSRAYITACVGLTLQKEVSVAGRIVPNKLIKDLEEGHVSIASQFSDGWPNDSREHWDPDYLLTNRTEYLKDILPESNNHHLEVALGLFESFYKKGYLDNQYFSVDMELFL